MRRYLNLFALVLLAACTPVSRDLAAPVVRSQEAVAELSQLGQRMVGTGEALMVTSARALKSVSGVNADAGKEYLILDVTIEALQDNQQYSLLAFALTDADGHAYGYSLLAPAPQLTSNTNLAKGNLVQGNIAFQVLQNAKGLVLTYQSKVSGGDTFRIKLGDAPPMPTH